MATRSAGRVTIRVIPDSTGFRRDLRTALDRIEKVTRVHVPAELVVTRESIRELRRQLADLQVKIKVEPYITQERLRELQEQVENLNPQLDIGLNSALARARLAVLTRPRIVELIVRVNQASAAKAAATIAALSGVRVLSNTFDRFFDAIRNLDKNAPRLGAIVTGITALSGAILALTSNLASLAGSFAQLGQISVLLPAFFTAAAINIGVLIAAFKDMKDVLADLGPEFTNLQDIISSRFWTEAAQPIRDLTYNLLPTLRRTLGELASAWGRLFGELSRSLQDEVTPDKLTFMMNNLTKSVDIATRAMRPLVSAFTTLGMFGSQYLPRLSEWLVKLSDQFNNFITEAANDGRLDQWAERGIEAFKDLGRVLRETTRVFAALTKAANAAGGAGFDQLADGLERMADAMNTADFQTTLATIFRGAHGLMEGVINGFVRLGPYIADFAPSIEHAFVTSGLIIEQFLVNLGRLVSDNQFQRGVGMLFDGFQSFMKALEPAAPFIGRIVGLIAEIAGVMLQAFGPVVSDALILFAGVFEEIWVALQPLVPVLSELVRSLLPSFASIMEALVPVVEALVPIIEALAPVFADFIKVMTPYVIEWLKDFAEDLRSFENLDVTAISNFVVEMGKAVGAIDDFLRIASSPQETYAFLNSDAVKTFNDEVNQHFEDFWAGISATLDRFNEEINGKLDTFWDDIKLSFEEIQTNGPVWDTFWQGIASVVNTYAPGIGPVASTAINTAADAIRGISIVAPGWSTFWMSLTNPVQLALTLVANHAQSGMGVTAGKMVAGFLGISARWQTDWPTLLPIVTQTMQNIGTNVQFGFPGIVAAVLGGMLQIDSQFGLGWSNVLASVGRWFSQIVGGVGRGILDVVAQSDTLPGKILRGLQNITGFFSAGFAMIADFANGIRAGSNLAQTAIQMVIAAVTKHLPGSPAEVGPLSGQGYSLIRGQHLMQDFAKGMRSRTDDVKSAALDAAYAASFNGAGASFASVPSVSDMNAARALVNIEGDYYGATPERVAQDFDNKTRRAALAVSLRSVGK